MVKYCLTWNCFPKSIFGYFWLVYDTGTPFQPGAKILSWWLFFFGIAMLSLYIFDLNMM